jgi:hypothetical protein
MTGGRGEMPVGIHCYDIFQLYKGHIDYLYVKIKNIDGINSKKVSTFALDNEALKGRC